ncbi:SulP family inorganic anion transporter [Litoribrevibacter euphylliae]|uniref:SulP family inorganic anion transporter n=1 Tax=Litoribrevibacter euphylliae TaxID=1834034 RepID=A0ABV7HAV7_9GAMM
MQQSKLASVFPVFQWGKQYSKTTLVDDVIASLVITMMLIPQSLAYALLAGLPPQIGLYASLFPLVAYAIFGSSGALSVGPFAIASLMTASALNGMHRFALEGSGIESQPDILLGAIVLALLVGGFLFLFGAFRLGFLTNFISAPVVTGFISASAIVIASSQLPNLLGLQETALPWFELVQEGSFTNYINGATVILAGVMVLVLLFLPKMLHRLILKFTQSDFLADTLSKATPVLVMLMSIGLVQTLGLEALGVAVIGDIPAGLPDLSLPDRQLTAWSTDMWQHLIVSALLISIISFVSSVSVAQAFAAKDRQRIDPNQEAIGLGMANVMSGLSGAFPVSASLSRSSVAMKAGAKTPATSAFTAIGITVSCLFLTPFLYYLPIATLAAMILTAVFSLFDWAAIKRTLQYSRKDFSALALTMILTLTLGVQWGLIGGVILSICLHLYRSSHPHVAILGRVPDTEHFRNIERYTGITHPSIISFRIDASLYFANARFLEDQINALVARHESAKHLVLMCSSINDIDASALESLVDINHYLEEAGVTFHLSEVKGPVLDRLKRSDFLELMTGKIYLSHFHAWTDLLDQEKASEHER